MADLAIIVFEVLLLFAVLRMRLREGTTTARADRPADGDHEAGRGTVSPGEESG